MTKTETIDKILKISKVKAEQVFDILIEKDDKYLSKLLTVIKKLK